MWRLTWTKGRGVPFELGALARQRVCAQLVIVGKLPKHHSTVITICMAAVAAMLNRDMAAIAIRHEGTGSAHLLILP
eukprot:6191715-Pleurochrysis_carterae.AAC.1